MIVVFEQYQFNLHTLQLVRQGRVVELRPKTAELLRELIVARDTVTSKRELIVRVWKTEHVSDQSLFQAISELRRTLQPVHAIKTFPNRGYQLSVPVIEKPDARVYSAAAVWAWMAAGIVTLLAMSILLVPKTEAPEIVHHSLPALDTFSLGVAALQQGNAHRATELLQLSLIERPDFSEARLLLAEASLLNGNPRSARQQAQAMLDSTVPLNSAYTLIGAMDLLSRSEQALGQNYSALQWAAQAVTHADNQGFKCTAADLQDRLWQLLDATRHNSTALLTSPVNEPPLMQQILQAASVSESDSGAITAWSHLDELFEHRVDTERPAHCARPGGVPPAGYAPVEVEPERLVVQYRAFKSLI